MGTYESVQEKLRPDLCRFVEWILLQKIPAAQVVDLALSRSFSFLRAMTDERYISLWLLTIVRRQAIEMERDYEILKSQAEKRLYHPDPEWTSRLNPVGFASPVIRMRHAIRCLDRSSREVLVLQSLFGCSLFEISEITGHPIEYISVRLSKARQCLMANCDGDAVDSGDLSPDLAPNARKALCAE